jgi:hypothetical protein
MKTHRLFASAALAALSIVGAAQAKPKPPAPPTAPPTPTVAYFAIDPNPTGTMMFGSKGSDVATSYGSVAAHNDVTITPGTPADFASGFAAVSPIKGGSLTTITFTPKNPNEFNSFSFRGQDLAANQTIDIIVQDNQGHAAETFAFTEAKANADFARIGILAQMQSETIKWVEIVNSGGFGGAKQFEFSCVQATKSCPNGGGYGGGAVPEPGTWALVLMGVGAVGASMRARRSRTAAA